MLRGFLINILHKYINIFQYGETKPKVPLVKFNKETFLINL